MYCGLFLNHNDSRQGLILRPVSGLCVKKKVAHVDLKRRRRYSGGRYQERNFRDLSAGYGFRQDISHLAGILSASGLPDLNLRQHPVPLWRLRILKGQLEPQRQRISRCRFASGILHCEHRKRSPLHRLGNMLIPHLCKPVIRADEEIVPGDVAFSIERRSMRMYFPGILVPLQLHGVRQFPPRRQRPAVDISRPHLFRSPPEPTLRPASPIAPAVPVIERHIAYR